VARKFRDLLVILSKQLIYRTVDVIYINYFCNTNKENCARNYFPI